MEIQETLFISNSNNHNRGFILKSVSLFLLLFLAYNFSIKFNPPRIVVFDNQYKNNIATAQRYIYDYSTVSKVIVGSSMSAFLNNELLLDNNVYNLALRGSGPMTGLYLIKEINSVPEIIIIETNAILLSIDNEFIDKLMSPVSFHLQKLFPCLRPEFQPINIFINSLLNLSQKKYSLNTFDRRRFNTAFHHKKKKFSKSPDPELISKQMIELQDKIIDLTKMGIKVVFFEIPIHDELRTSTFMNKLRSELKMRFPEDKYTWIDELSILENETSDGIHLTTKAGNNVTKQLLKIL